MSFRRAGALTGAVAAALASAACGGGDGAPATPPAAAKGFVEVGRAAHLSFRMHFLPGEQGEKFKINLYDHGTGVAAADVNGDGLDDLYFVDQLGDNGLFLNDGHGGF